MADQSGLPGHPPVCRPGISSVNAASLEEEAFPVPIELKPA